MLNILFGDTEDVIYNTDVYFNNTYEDSWITSDLGKKIIKDIDKSEVRGANCIESYVLGQIPPTSLSGGTKTLLLMLNDKEHVFNASTCGDNCAEWILKIAEQEDITINLYHTMNFGDKDFCIRIVNNNTVVHNMKELLPVAFEFLNSKEA